MEIVNFSIHPEFSNSTRIITTIKVNLGLQREFMWTIIIADVTKPIIGADFIQHFGLLIDLKRNKLIDPLTGLHSMCLRRNSDETTEI